MESICFQRGGQHVGNIVSGAPLLGHEAMPQLLEFAPAGCVSERIAHNTNKLAIGSWTTWAML